MYLNISQIITSDIYAPIRPTNNIFCRFVARIVRNEKNLAPKSIAVFTLYFIFSLVIRDDKN